MTISSFPSVLSPISSRFPSISMHFLQVSLNFVWFSIPPFIFIDKITYANPYLSKEVQGEVKYGSSPECDLTNHTYTSGTLSVRYGEGLIPIQEIGMFRITLPALEISDEDKLILNYEMLMFTTKPEKNEKNEEYTTSGYFPVYEGKFLIRRLRNGLCDYFMILTGTRNFGAVECMLHSSILDYRFSTDTSLAHLGQPVNGSYCKEFSELFKAITQNCMICFGIWKRNSFEGDLWVDIGGIRW